MIKTLHLNNSSTLYQSGSGKKQTGTKILGCPLRQCIVFALLSVLIPLGATTTKTVGNSGADYSTVGAAFTAINNGSISGDIELQLIASTTETASATLYQSGYNGVSSYSSVKIYPTVDAVVISGTLAAPLINLNNADNVVIDGRKDQNGTTASMTITNLSSSASAGTSTIRFINDACNNTIQYCNINGSETATASGIVFVSTASSSGNDYNTIAYNNISSSSDATRPINAIYSAGTSGKENDNLTISNNQIFNTFSRSSASYAINLTTATTSATISDNSIFETSTFTPTASVGYTAININNSSGNDFTVTGNYIGGQAAECGGNAFSKTNEYNNTFNAIYLTAGTSTASNVQGNTISNINWSNSANASWIGVNIGGGSVNVGDVSGNTIGSTDASDSILVTNSSNNGNVYGIYVSSTGTVNIEDNTISTIATNNSNASYATNLYGIYKSGTAGTLIVKNNSIGDESRPNNLTARSASTGNGQNIYGISSACSGTINIAGNTVANLTNLSLSTGVTSTAYGILSSAGTTTQITDNSVHDITSSYAFNTNAGTVGISVTDTTATHSISGNKIYKLTNTNAAFSGAIIGLNITGPVRYTNTINGNFVYNLSVNSASAGASIYGINNTGGASTIYNNIVSLNVNTNSTVAGLRDTGGKNSISFNTLYIGGSSNSTSYRTYAFLSSPSTTRSVLNNLFVNTHSTTGGSSINYAAYINSSTGLSQESNDYVANGTGSILSNGSYYNGTNNINTDPGFSNAGGDNADDYYPSSTQIGGTSISTITTDFDDVERKNPTMGALENGVITFNVQLYSNGTLAKEVNNLKAGFDYINSGKVKGDIEIKIQKSTVEKGTATLYQSGYNNISAYNSIKIYPTESGLSISGDLASPLIDLNNADNVTIDGRVNATGSACDLTLRNSNASTSTTTSTIRFINDASNNNINYCNILGAETSASSGVILLSTSTQTTGNDNNHIAYNNISNVSQTARPVNAVYSAGTSGKGNDSIIINTNKIYNTFNPALSSNAILLGSNTNSCTIINNSIYDTESFSPTANATYRGISMTDTSSGGHQVISNYIGGTSAQCGGTSWTKTSSNSNLFNGIYLNTNSTATTSVQGNTIGKINWSNAGGSTWTGILANAGTVNIGTVSGNVIGSATSTGSITVSDTINSNVYGIYINSASTVAIENNTIGSITAINSVATKSNNLYGIYKTNTAGSTTIRYNQLGSSETANSLFASSASTANSQSVFGIYNSGTGDIVINSNQIANITNNTTNASTSTAGMATGIYSSAGATNTINSNIIYNVSNSNLNTNSGYNASVSGISTNNASTRSLTGNTIYNLSNTNTGFAGWVNGICINGATTGNTINSNFIYGLSSNSAATTAILCGIRISSGTSSYYNNIVSINTNSPATIYGIYEWGSNSSNNNSIYFNTAYIGGTLTAGNSSKSYGLYCNSNANTRVVENNIFYNARSTTGGSSLHYGAYFSSSTNLTTAYNDIYANGTGAIASNGSYSSGSDNISIDPLFKSAGSTTAADYYPTSSLLGGIGVTGITTDYAGTTRSNPTMGAFENSEIAYNIRVCNASGDVLGKHNSIKGAFDAINTGRYTGNLVVKLDKSSTVESASATLYQSGYNNVSNYSSVKIYPTSSGISITGTIAGSPIIELNNADGVTIDGRVNGTGTTADLTLANYSTSSVAGTSTVRFINDASADTICYSNIQGSETNTGSAVIFFSTASTSGNDNNVITKNNISCAANNRPANAIYSNGTASKENDNITVSENNIFDIFNPGISSNGIALAANTTTCLISNNSIYETSTLTPTTATTYNGISVNNSSGTGFTISGNYIGGNAQKCSGSPLTKSSNNTVFNAIYVNAGSTSASNIQGNTISNFNWSNSGTSNWSAINANAGTLNIGTTSGNLIGAITGSGSITVTDSVGSGAVYGILVSSTSATDIENNSIGAITTANGTSTAATSIYGIYKTNVAGSTTIINNQIGSSTTDGSIHASSASTTSQQNCHGIVFSGTETAVIRGNTVSGITNSSTYNAGSSVYGISASTGTSNEISKNIIFNLKVANTYSLSLAGISATGTSTIRTINGNTIHDLTNTNASSTGYVTGIYFNGSTSSANKVSNNFIYNLGAHASSAGTYLVGIFNNNGIDSIYNNIVSLGGNTNSRLAGIMDITGNSTIEHNTLYIYGTGPTTTYRTYGLYTSTTNSRVIKNNLFINTRSTTGGSSLHYAADYSNSTGLTQGYNDYYITGTGGVLSSSTYASATGNISKNPLFANAGGTGIESYFASASSLGGNAVNIKTDIYGTSRSTTSPTMGAWEEPSGSDTIPLYVRWKNSSWSSSTLASKGSVLSGTMQETSGGGNREYLFDSGNLSSKWISGVNALVNKTMKVGRSSISATNGTISTSNGYYYTFNIEKAKTDTLTTTILSTSYLPRTFSSIAQNNDTILATLNNSLQNGEYCYLRYSTDNWSSSSVIAMNSGVNPYKATIPAFNQNTTLYYYCFTSNQANLTDASTSDYFALSLDNNAGANYKYLSTPTISSFAASPNNSDAHTAYYGSTIVVKGKNLSTINEVRIGGASGTLVSGVAQTDTTLTFTTNVKVAGKIYVASSTGSASSAETLNYAGIVSTQTGDWNTAATWQGAALPTATDIVTINHAIATSSAIAIRKLIVNSSKTLTVSSAISPDSITNSGTIKLINGSIAAVNSLTKTGNGCIQIGTSSSVPANVSWPDTVKYNSTTLQTVIQGTYENLNAENTSGIAIASATTVTVTGILKIASGAVTVNTNSKLTANTIQNNIGVSGLVVKSGANQNNGTLIYHNSTPVYGTVEFYSKAYYDSNGATGYKYKWQYFGIPISTVTASPTFNGSYVRSYNEATDSWTSLSNQSTLSPLKGYEMTQTAGKTISYKGYINNQDYTLALSATNTKTNLLSNPYTCAIDISKMTFNDGTDATVYFFNTGSATDLQANSSKTDSLGYPGQYFAVPKNLAGTVMFNSVVYPSTIPSMQGFMLLNESANTFTMSYNNGTKNTEQQRVRQQANTAMSMTQLVVKGTKYSDKALIVLNDACSQGFDKGWDGRKLFGASYTPQVFTITSADQLQTDTRDSLNNTTIGFIPGTDTEYTMTIKNRNNNRNYSNLYLYDTKTAVYTDINADSTTYSFSSSSTDASARFRIVTYKTSITENHTTTTKSQVYANKDEIHIECTEKSHLIIYNTEGKCVLTRKNLLGSTILNSGFLPGVYSYKLISDQSTTLNGKIIIQ